MPDTAFESLRLSLDEFIVEHVITSWGIGFHGSSGVVATADLKHTGVGRAAFLATAPCRSEFAAMSAAADKPLVLPVLLDSATLRDHYGLSEAEIARAWRALPTCRIGDARRIKVRREELEAWIEGFRRAPADRMSA